ncbi:MAG: hypothetical protein ACXWAT_01985 [Methylobacter sp.]
MSKLIELNVLDIYLDTQNPRHDPINDQAEIIKHLVKKESIKNLAKDIAAYGLSPIDLFAVIKDESNNFIVVEGNRRLCALTLLNDPKLSPEGDVVYFKGLRTAKTKIPSKVNCMQFTSRDAANIWIERRHGGEQDGRGTKQWSADQKTRHNRRLLKPDANALANSILEYASESGLLPKVREDKILTTASRYLGNPDFRKTIGVVSSRSEANVVINVPHDEFNKVLIRFCNDLLDDASPVSSRTKKSDWEEYARQLVQESIAPVTRSENRSLNINNKYQKVDNEIQVQPNIVKTANQDVSQTSESEFSSTVQSDKSSVDSKTEPLSRINKHPNDRKFIVPSNFKPRISDVTLRKVFEELRTIEVDTYTLAAALLCRAFLENLNSSFYEKMTGIYDKNNKANFVLEKVIPLIEKDQNNLSKNESNALGALKRVQSNEKNVFSFKTLGAYAHAGFYPNARELKLEWDNISEILIYMLKKI